jgi:hypothetical protein
MANCTITKKNHRVTWKCVSGGTLSFTVGQDRFVIFWLSISDSLGKGIEDDISSQGPQIIVKPLTVKGNLCHKNTKTTMLGGSRLFSGGEI